MKRLLLVAVILISGTAIASAQSNKVVFGPLEGDDAGVLTVHNGEDIEIEMWVRTDPDNPAPFVGVSHALMSEDEIIADRTGAQLDPDYDMPNWELVFVDGPYGHDPGSSYPIPVGHTCEIQAALWVVFNPPVGDPLDTQGEWDYYGAFLMTCNTDVPVDNTYYPFSAGWYPHNGYGFRWSFDVPPGGYVEPEQSYGGLHFAPITNRIVFGPLEGEDAGVLTVHNGEDIEIEMWVRTDPDNPAPVEGLGHALMSEDEIIAERNGAQLDPDYDMPNWELVFVDGPYVHDPGSSYPIPVGNTCEIQVALWVFVNPPVGDPLDTQGEWDYYGAFLMTCNTDVPIDNTYYPFSMGWYPHTGEGTIWAFGPPGGRIEPEQSYGGLYFEQGPCEYIPGDCNANGNPLELNDVIMMISTYRGTAPVPFTCPCLPHGDEFAVTLDPNGNCVPNELSDVIIEIAAYRGTATASGCPDCPGSEEILIGKNEVK